MQTTTATPADLFGAPISAYTRAQAIEDGLLIDVSTTAREAGTVWPVAMTAAAWADCVEWTDATEARKGYIGQSESGRLWDVCWMLSRVLLRAARLGLQASPSYPMYVELLRTPREGRGVKPRLVHLKFIIGPDDAGRPCITVMMPGED
ncbi:MAG: hypothetical protein RBR52_11700 [Thiomonas sp.]|uniref:DUF6573 family protein n=1 Tax=Thiomonas sp. TaxID=2047785 RepID=UPI002A35ABFE|nr:DUF6573 family protein [Thiomonas sp.]MDY0331142.1 hypothetical protein [Thiomonas sp.]